MRLICPNCDAQYEVDDRAIPEGGRDVQCSHCGHAWFQMSPELEAALAAEDELYGTAEDQMAATAPAAAPQAPEPDVPPEPEPAPAPEAEPEPLPVPPPMPQRRTLDDNLLSVLREEAEREAAQRRVEEPRPVETQPDLGLPEPESAAAGVAARLRIAQMKGAEPEPAPAKPALRRDLLPDIEEINSTLRASSEPRSEAAAAARLSEAAAAERSGFRSGFVLMMTLAVVLMLTYVSAPRIAQHLPDLAEPLQSYVAGVDRARLWLDGVLQSAINALNGPQA